jgi:hypothetical protein
MGQEHQEPIGVEDSVRLHTPLRPAAVVVVQDTAMDAAPLAHPVIAEWAAVAAMVELTTARHMELQVVVVQDLPAKLPATAPAAAMASPAVVGQVAQMGVTESHTLTARAMDTVAAAALAAAAAVAVLPMAVVGADLAS